jgi:sugar phosphate isomerase/epimerase
MSRGPATFKQGDLARALRAARAAGFDRVEFDPVTGRYLFRTEDQTADVPTGNFFDEKLRNDNAGNSEHSTVQEPARQVANLLPRGRA